MAVKILHSSDTKVIEKCHNRFEHSPDFSRMRNYKYIPVFIYQPQFKMGGVMNPFLLPKSSKFLGKSHSMINRYVLHETEDNAYYIAMNSPNKETLGMMDANFLGGEVYAVTPEALLNLDYILSNHDIFRREERSFVLVDQDTPFKGEDGKKRHPIIKCWVYLGVPSYWAKHKLSKRPIVNNYVHNKYFWVS